MGDNQKATSIGDVIKLCVEDWGAFIRFAMLLATCMAVLGGGAIGAFMVLRSVTGSAPASLSFSAFGTGVVMESIGESDRRLEYLIMVHPRGWQSTRIQVNPGDSVIFEATGSVQISLNSIVESVEQRYRIERVLGQALNVAGGELPEDVMTSEQIDSLALPRPWVGPDGDVQGELVDHR